MKKIMLHVCCAPCAGAVVEKLTKNFEVVLGWVDGNIWPKKEWKKRRAEVRRLGEKFGCKIIEKEWENKKWKEFVSGLEKEPEGGKRCLKCYEWRLRKIFELAKKERCEIVGTSLGIGPHKKGKIVLGILKKMGEKFEIEVLEDAFTELWRRGCEISKEEKWYRQNYCGCEFSVK